jgi:hypothetical protein
MSKPAPVVPLGHDERQIFGCGIENHDEADSKSIPQKKEGGEKDDDPVGPLGPAGFDQESLKIIPLTAAEFAFRETVSPDDRGCVGQVPFPFPDLEHVLIHASVSLPLPAAAETAFRIKAFQRNPDHDINHTHMDHKPGDDVDDDGPESGEMDESHGLGFSFLVFTVRPFQGTLFMRKMRRSDNPKTVTKKIRGT